MEITNDSGRRSPPIDRSLTPSFLSIADLSLKCSPYGKGCVISFIGRINASSARSVFLLFTSDGRTGRADQSCSATGPVSARCSLTAAFSSAISRPTCLPASGWCGSRRTGPRYRAVSVWSLRCRRLCRQDRAERGCLDYALSLASPSAGIICGATSLEGSVIVPPVQVFSSSVGSVSDLAIGSNGGKPFILFTYQHSGYSWLMFATSPSGDNLFRAPPRSTAATTH